MILAGISLDMILSKIVGCFKISDVGLTPCSEAIMRVGLRMRGVGRRDVYVVIGRNGRKRARATGSTKAMRIDVMLKRFLEMVQILMTILCIDADFSDAFMIPFGVKILQKIPYPCLCSQPAKYCYSYSLSHQETWDLCGAQLAW